MDDWADILTSYHQPSCQAEALTRRGAPTEWKQRCTCRLDEVIEGVQQLQDRLGDLEAERRVEA
jgi:hypothetical protein